MKVCSTYYENENKEADEISVRAASPVLPPSPLLSPLLFSSPLPPSRCPSGSQTQKCLQDMAIPLGKIQKCAL